MADEVFTDEQLDEYLESIRRGVGADLAARAIGTTGTMMRRLRKRDPVFASRYQEAYDEGREHYRERLRAQARLRALNADNPSDRILEVELATHVPGYEHLRRDRMKVDGRIEHGVILTLDPAALDALPLDKLVALRELLEEAGGGIIDGEARELTEGE
jgi:hypothetical protein